MTLVAALKRLAADGASTEEIIAEVDRQLRPKRDKDAARQRRHRERLRMSRGRENGHADGHADAPECHADAQVINGAQPPSPSNSSHADGHVDKLPPAKESLPHTPSKKNTPRETRAREIAWPEDFDLDDDRRQEAADFGYTDPTKVERMWRAFRDHALANGRTCASRNRGWPAAWRMWVNKQVDFEPRGRAPPAQQTLLFPINGRRQEDQLHAVARRNHENAVAEFERELAQSGAAGVPDGPRAAAAG